MKNILLVLGILLSQIANSQVENGTLTIRFAETYEYNSNTGEHNLISEDWTNLKFYFHEDYYLIYDDKSDPVQVFWQHSETNDISSSYVLEDSRVFIFYYESQELLFFWNWNEDINLHENYVVWGKTSFEADN